MFLHADFQHMFFNMFSLWMFGRTLEIDLGPKKFLTYFFVCGVGAALLHMGVAAVEWLNIKSHVAAEAATMGVSAAQLANKIFTNHAMLGASGAVMGVVMSFGVLHPNAMVMLMFPPIPMKAKWFVVIFLVIEFSAGVVGVSDSIAHFAHLGGMLWGWLLLRYWKKTHQIYF
jgi:membrane associated rhomboid family serine protease